MNFNNVITKRHHFQHSNRQKILPLFVVFLCRAALAGALDFGVIVQEGFEASGGNEPFVPLWTQNAGPWFSQVVNEELSFQLSLDFSLAYAPANSNTAGKKWRPVFQVNRAQVLWRPLPLLAVEAGRVFFEDPMGRIASGLFDGVKVTLNWEQNTLNAALLYSGLQYKERAKIIMTEGDLGDYADNDSYFAPGRLILSAFWQSRYLSDKTLDLGALGQIDLRSQGEKLHSQYLLGKFSFPVFSFIDVSTGAIIGVKEQDSGGALSFAANLSLAFALPGALADQLSLSGYVSSGSVGPYLRPYFPVNALAEGEVFRPSLAGIYAVKLSYQLVPFKHTHLNATGRYFWRSTRDIIPGVAGLNNSTKDNLGAELYASGIWTPLSDLSLSLGGGVFFPSGPVKELGTEIMWKAAAAVILSL
ncbi:MAG: hypothetical protein LBT39_00765 [Treponema sp.]|jgi:hypothetical protein|nr:hypothetical protein [Treponema sp.]